ncbi:MAG: asparagine synthase-related protein [Pseudomonadota bacterium]
MSAIFGVVRTDGALVSEREIGRMANTLAHRGPDGRHIAVHDGVGMGHCLMRVTQEDWHEAQPIRDGGITLVADIRLDNREALASALGIDDTALRDMPDSVILLAAYRHWGGECASHLLGDFTFAIWDSATRALTVARDHMGQRGLFYHHGDGFFAFASEAKALWAVEGVPRRLSEKAIGYRLLFPVDITPGATLYDRIAILPGGCLLVLTGDGSCEMRTYWEPQPAPEHIGRDETYYIEAYRRVLGEAVACRLRRLTRPPALLFSGGFDSGGIAALAAPVVVAQGRQLIALCSALAEDAPPPVRDSRAAAEAFRRYPHIDLRYFVRGDETPFSDIEATFAATEDSAGTAYVRRGLYRMASSAGARLVLDGTGGDVTLNVRAGAMLGRFLLRGRVITFAREVRARRRVTGRSLRHVIREDVLPALIPLWLSAAIRSYRRRGVPMWRTRAINAAFAQRLFDDGTINPKRLIVPAPAYHRWQARWLDFLRKMAWGEPLETILAASEGLTYSRPYQDRRVVELSLAIPEALQFRCGNERYLARQALADVLPERLLRSGPGNVSEGPDMYRALRDSVPAALAAVQTLDQDSRLSRYIDFAKVMESIAPLNAAVDRPEEISRLNLRALHRASRTIALARFIAWFDDSNR